MLIIPQNRIDNPKTIDQELIEKELGLGKPVIVQFSDSIYTDMQLAQLNELCSIYDSNFEIRFYGHYFSSFDVNVLKKIPNVKALSLDCLVSNIDTLKSLLRLQKLRLGIFELEKTEILQFENLKGLSTLFIGETRTKALNLEYLKDYRDLKQLIIGAHTKNLHAIGELNSLELLSLNSIPKAPIAFINHLKKLKRLSFTLGGRENLHELGNNNIEHLDIFRVRGFNSLENISSFRKLKTLHIEDIPHIQRLHFGEELPDLSDLRLLNCKALDTFTGIEHLPALHHLHINKTALDFERVMQQALPRTLKVFSFYTSQSKVNKDIKAILESKGYSEFD